ncbi:nucleoside-triphosphate diphosphatase [Streptococcus sp. KHUD_017]
MARKRDSCGACNIMTNNIYEYKDDQDWYVGVWDVYGGIYSLIKDPLDLDFMDLARIFRDEENGFPITITVMRWSSNFRLLSFIVEILNAEGGRNLEVIQRQGTLLLVENGQLLHVELPKEGVDVEAYFETNKVRETLLIATRNEGKTKEFRAIFDKLGYDVENLNDYPDLPEVAETGMTFEENARLKAETISKLTGKMVLADDSGLKVDVLGGLPGVWSARFAGVGATDQENNAKLLHELAMVFELKDRSAQFHTTLVVASPGKESLVVEADWPGYINFEPKGENGFGYDPLFLVGETGKSSAELTLEEKNSQSHRALAVKKLLEVFPSWQSKPSL